MAVFRGSVASDGLVYLDAAWTDPTSGAAGLGIGAFDPISGTVVNRWPLPEPFSSGSGAFAVDGAGNVWEGVNSWGTQPLMGFARLDPSGNLRIFPTTVFSSGSGPSNLMSSPDGSIIGNAGSTWYRVSPDGTQEALPQPIDGTLPIDSGYLDGDGALWTVSYKFNNPGYTYELFETSLSGSHVVAFPSTWNVRWAATRGLVGDRIFFSYAATGSVTIQYGSMSLTDHTFQTLQNLPDTPSHTGPDGQLWSCSVDGNGDLVRYDPVTDTANTTAANRSCDSVPTRGPGNTMWSTSQDNQVVRYSLR
jgi:hypothetical protein